MCKNCEVLGLPQTRLRIFLKPNHFNSLHPIATRVRADVNVALRVTRNGVHVRSELTAIVAPVAERTNRLHRVAAQDPDLPI